MSHLGVVAVCPVVVGGHTAEHFCDDQPLSKSRVTLTVIASTELTFVSGIGHLE